jgi:glycosyltransferase 2 family protein
MRRVLGSIWFRLVVTLALLALVALQVDWAAFLERVAGGSPAWLAVALLLVLAALATGAARWWWLLSAAGIRLTAAEVARVYAVSTFASTFLPTSIGGDVARALLVTRDGRMLVRVGLTILVDRAGAFVGMLVVAWGAVLLVPAVLPDGVLALLAVLTALAVAGGLVLLWLAAGGGRSLTRRLPERIRAPLSGAREVIAVYGRNPRTLPVLLTTSVAFQILAAAQLWAIAEALDLPLSFAAAAVTLTLVTVATLVPLSIAGFGIREGSYVVLLAPLGIDATDATAISLTAVVVLLVASLPGALLLVRRGMRPVLA